MAARKAKAIRPRRAFSAEYKLEAVQRAAERRTNGVPFTQIARELGITTNLLRAWTRHVSAARRGAHPTDVFPGQGRLPSEEAELRRLEREVRPLTQENAFLKTARSNPAVMSLRERTAPCNPAAPFFSLACSRSVCLLMPPLRSDVFRALHLSSTHPST
jgi:transposase-like protein